MSEPGPIVGRVVNTSLNGIRFKPKGTFILRELEIEIPAYALKRLLYAVIKENSQDRIPPLEQVETLSMDIDDSGTATLFCTIKTPAPSAEPLP